MTEATALRDALAAAGLDDEPIDVRITGGGDISTAWRVTCKDCTVVIKTFGRPADGNATPPHGMYEGEADGLNALRTIGGVRTPDVLAVTPSALVMEELEPAPDDDPVFWARAGRALAIMHGMLGPRFGWDRDGWLGRLRQDNSWHDDGHEFFATRRILRWLPEPAVAAALDASDRAGLERVCARLPQLVPPAPPCLTHGDLARSNILADGRRPAWIDPAVSWMWPEVDLSMIYCLGRIHPPSRVPDRFYEAYGDIRPLDPDWRDRMPLLHLRELLSLLAHFGNDRWDLVGQIRDVLRTFA
ncbi:MAG TPA: fructosamine kinase family protein [Pseudonocardiaceae bacterium]|jgi:fructosamine-3-kinase|nr:fructosamine kinase family protein [Pseudonocardiaceae bacterium]